VGLPTIERDVLMLLSARGAFGRRLAIALLASVMVALAAAGTASARPGQSDPAQGPCTEAARQAMPEGEGHDHADVGRHDLACRMREVAFDSLRDELGARQDVVLGEMDVEADLAAVAVAYPESGFLLFDVSDPAAPVFLSWYRGSECEGAAIDVDCGAFVDLSGDGTVAFLSVQDISVVPGGAPQLGPDPVSTPGVFVVDISDPRQPVRTQIYPVVSFGGVHTSRSHTVPQGPEGNGRAPGGYLFSVANSVGIEVTRVDRLGGRPVLTPVHRIEIDEVHDMFLQDDPTTGRTYMYVAAGFDTGFLVYDVTDPAAPELLAEWDLTPRCEEDWYSHTIDVTTRNGHRYVTLPAEGFEGGEQSAEDQAEGCGKVVGNGDKAVPMWIVDATDLSALGQPGDSEAALAAKSRSALVTTWSNPANRVAGNLTFSPHNQQIVGDLIYLSNYHGGVYVLDASAAFAGRPERPVEMGFIVPSGAETRPFYDPLIDPLVIPFFSTFTRARSTIWDQVYYKGYSLAADMYGGFYSLRYDGEDEASGKGKRP
jgi:hypothetical protein